MSVNYASKEKTARGLHTTTAFATNFLDIPTQGSDHLFYTLESPSVLSAHVMRCNHPSVMPRMHLSERWELVPYAPVIDAARGFVEQTGDGL
jgi:hypothetical protein